MTIKPPINYDYIVIGSGVGGGLAANRLSKFGKKVLIIESGQQFPGNKSVSRSIFANYWNGGVVPMIGPFICPFGQAKVFGGGSVINGALVWRTPQKVLKKWATLFPGSVYASPDWTKTESRLLEELGVSDSHISYQNGNVASKILVDAAKNAQMEAVKVPRATSGCINANRCGSGCLNEAKNSVDKVFLNENENLSILKQSSVFKIKRSGSNWSVHYKQSETNKIVQSKSVIISAGATESANLLRKSKLSKAAGKNFKFHLNYKLIAKFNDNIYPENGTILTDQIQQFMDDGILMMSSNFTLPYLASSLAHLSPDKFNKFMRQSEKTAIFTVMVRPEVKARVHSFFNQTICFWKWDDKSFIASKRGMSLLSNLLFNAGAEELVLPIKNTSSIAGSSIEADKMINEIREKDLMGSSVHGMSACRMGNNPNTSVVDFNGRVWGEKNLYVLDSSILPDNIGESPQGTILTTVEMILKRWKL